MKTALLAGTLAALLGAGIPAGQAVAQSTAAPADMAGRHTMQGTVTKVDAKRGWIDVKTDEGSMKLQFPPAALADVKAGDSVSVELGMTRAAMGTTTKTK